MAPAFDLILECDGELITETIQASDADAAWRHGVRSYLGSIVGVVSRDGPFTASGEESTKS